MTGAGECVVGVAKTAELCTAGITAEHSCSGHDDTYGAKKGVLSSAVNVGKPVLKQMAGYPDHLISDCPIAARHIVHGIGENQGAEAASPRPAAAAYGL